ncbi:hypothetical protein IHN58_19945, partial [Deinococcus sp. 12RED42]|nr:hypothetical protein [Deinococcus sp. 12RED42]
MTDPHPDQPHPDRTDTDQTDTDLSGADGTDGTLTLDAAPPGIPDGARVWLVPTPVGN